MDNLYIHTRGGKKKRDREKSGHFLILYLLISVTSNFIMCEHKGITILGKFRVQAPAKDKINCI